MAIDLSQFKGKNIHIIGIAGMEGLAVWRLFKKHGIIVTLHDFSDNLEALKENLFSFHDYLSEKEKTEIWKRLAKEKICLKEDYLKGTPEADIIFVSQGWFRYPMNKPLLNLRGEVEFKQLTELYFDYFPGIIIGITGSSGKSTTTNLIYHLIKDLPKRKIWLSGNDRQNPPVILEIENAKANDILILEISNRQLIDLKASPNIAVVTTITSTHLDDHKTFENYLIAKKNIVRYQKETDLAILNYNNAWVREFANETSAQVQWFGVETAVGLKGAFLVDDKLNFIFNKTESFLDVKDLKIPGVHNVANALAASLVARHLNINNLEISQKLAEFKGLKHRLELVAEFKGVKFYNDTQATNPEAAQAAIESFPNDSKIIIAGGKKKDNSVDFKPWLKSIIHNKVKALFLIGEAENQIVTELNKIGKFKLQIEKCHNMETAVAQAFANLDETGVVLMSPACESFGEFTDYRERGKRFAKEVLKQIDEYSN